MNENKKVPKIRFPEFNGDWEEKKIKDIFSERLERSSYGELISVTINSGVIRASEIDRKDNSSEDKSNYKLVNKGDIAYNSMRMWQGASGYSSFDGILSPAYTVIVPKESISSKFFSYKFKQYNMIQIFKRTSQGMTSDTWNLKFKQLGNIKVFLPSFQEQQKIGNFFKKLDESISLQKNKVDNLKLQKKSLLQKMFPKNGETVPEIRFLEFSGDWEKKKLGEVADIVGGGTPSTKILEYWNGNIDWYSPVELENQIYLTNSRKKITKLGFEKSSTRLLPVGTVLFTSRAGIGKTAILKKEGTTNQGFQSIIPHERKLDSYFIFSMSYELKRYGELVGAGSTFVEVSGKQMSNMSMFLPSFQEQQKIGNFFKKLDTLILLNRQKLENLEKRKKGLLQKMFV